MGVAVRSANCCSALTRGPEIRAERELSDLGTPKTQKEFLFLVLFLLDKGEKGQLSALKSKRAVAFLRFLELMRQTLSVLPVGTFARGSASNGQEVIP